MKKTDRVKKLVFAALLSTYSVGVVADDGLTPGPGVFSGEKGRFSLLKALNKDQEQPSESPSKEVELTKPEPSIASSEANSEAKNTVSATSNVANKTAAKTELSEFQLYKEWRKFKADGSGDYHEFQQWLEYRALLKNAK